MSGLLILADGTRFEGESVGAEGIATGEAVFNTSMSGYQEIFTDPSYRGQVVVMTAPHIGNYGVAASDAQSPVPQCSGVVMRSLSRTASMAEGNTLTPRITSMSATRPEIRSSRWNVRPHADGSSTKRVMSPVR